MKKLQILGTGCQRCKSLAENVEAAAQALGLEYTLEKVTDINEIISFGVAVTPALAIDGDVKFTGKLLDVESLKSFLQ
ncbi:thioredoxin family protein [candidate division KSB3 bacterium]|uniref:Thioredoxin family protein n=1 Tax=candidate division KSB3 bacterium TaxID=2044937 RepID=A0A2G6E7T0_9BACT|nr:MAG: thioredoxin family protein [candidate division KSB3 bacterium]PIE30501.1 MAG: thioredoxin family protein [candidate division KSB3 bacterium]